MMDIEKVKAEAQQQIKDEEFQAAVEKMKEKLRNKRSWLDIVWPWRIVIVRKGE
jgi:DNA-binding transcriptional regulator GbsR (MarR family)